MNWIAVTISSDVTDHAGLPDDQGWLWLTGVVAVHAMLLAGAVMGMSQPKPLASPPAVIGMLVSAPKPAAVVPPKPLPSAPEPPKPRHVQIPKPAPLSPVLNTPPSERAVTPPPVEMATAMREEPAGAAPGAATAPPAPVAPPAAAPVIAPRTDAAHLNNPAPAYPAVSRRMSEQGRVLFDVFILADGRVGEIKLRHSSGFSRLDEAALDAVRRWRYVPARRGNEPIPYWYIQPITFSLDS